MSPWLTLILAGIFEVGFTTFLKLSNGSVKNPYFYGFLLCATISFYLLSRAILFIPLGTAYAVWTGIGASGTALIGIFFFQDPASFARIALLVLLVSSIIGLKLVSS